MLRLALSVFGLTLMIFSRGAWRGFGILLTMVLFGIAVRNWWKNAG